MPSSSAEATALEGSAVTAFDTVEDPDEDPLLLLLPPLLLPPTLKVVLMTGQAAPLTNDL